MAKPARRLVFESDQVAIFDDFLDPPVYRKVLDFLGGDRYQEVHAQGWRKVWRINDGWPLKGSTVYAGDTSQHPELPPPVCYPIRQDIDLFIGQLLSVMPQAEKTVGAQGRDWSTLAASTWIYPAGSALSLHNDGSRYSGAFTYFAHQSWDIHWGGYLLVLDPRTGKTTFGPNGEKDGLAWIDDTEENARVWDPGLAQCIFPKPNRLVFISQSADHLLSRVDANAGNHPRISISGFFRRVEPTASKLGGPA